MAAKHQKIEVSISSEYTTEEKKAIGQELVDLIVSRTERGEDVKGKPFKAYEPGYKKLKKAITGSSSPVDLHLTGDMLDALDVQGIKGSKLVIGFEKGSDENAKAEGNITGSYGQASPNKAKARNFLGLTSKEVESVLANYPLEDRGASKARSFISELAANLAEGSTNFLETLLKKK